MVYEAALSSVFLRSGIIFCPSDLFFREFLAIRVLRIGKSEGADHMGRRGAAMKI